jgi:hypothetical protein
LADNIAITAGTGTSVATDDIGGVQHQRVKLVLGADGVSDGDVASGNPMPVTGTVTVGSITAGDNNIGNVDVVSLPALAAGTNNIGDVDVLTVPAPLSTTGSGTEATALRVTLATDSTGVVSVDDNGGSLTVDHANDGASVMNASSSDGSTALTSTAQAIKGTAGSVLGWYIYNPNTVASFVQFYNTAQGSVTVGTTNPLFMITIPAGSAVAVDRGQSGITFGTAISWSATSTAGGNGAPTTALDAVCFYK